MTKILVPFKFDADFKLKLDMIAYDNKITKEGPGSVVGLVREALIKTYPALSESIVIVNDRVCKETKKKFKEKVGAF